MMSDISLTNTVIAMAAAFGAPLLLGLTPRPRLPAVVLLSESAQAREEPLAKSGPRTESKPAPVLVGRP